MQINCPDNGAIRIPESAPVRPSLCIELLQLVLCCGTAEVADLISHSLSTLLGCALAEMILHVKQTMKSIKNRKNNGRT